MTFIDAVQIVRISIIIIGQSMEQISVCHHEIVELILRYDLIASTFAENCSFTIGGMSSSREGRLWDSLLSLYR
jgi:hypothetical protein